MDFDTVIPYDTLVEKWNPILDHDSLPEIKDQHRKRTTAVLLENQEKALREQYIAEAGFGNQMAGTFTNPQVGTNNPALAGYDPILISMVRRAAPNLMAFDVAGVQPMTAPTGLIFAMRSRYGPQSDFLVNNNPITNKGQNEALFQEAWARFSGAGTTFAGAATLADGGVDPIALRALTTGTGYLSETNTFASFRAMLTSDGEQLGSSGFTGFREMSFSIERIPVIAGTRALKADYTTELAQDLKAVHGLDAETELANILSTEILAEINREMIYTIYRKAKAGCQQGDLSSAGSYDIIDDSDGRWSAERYRGLMYQIEREANVIAKETRRGKGNFIICSADVASALTMGGFLNISPALGVNLEVDDTGNIFCGVLNNKMKVFIDPYSKTSLNFCVVGYKGTITYDAGIFYCPYVPLQMFRAVGENTFQPKIGFKTRYGMVSNPFAEDTDINTLGGNQYYRIFQINNIHGAGTP